VRVLIAAKAPLPGNAKTRLSPPLPPELAARLAEAFLTDGWRCVVPWNQPDEAERLASRPAIKDAGERLALVEADLFNSAEVTRAVDLAESPQEPLGAVVNLVGGFAAGGRAHETPIEEFEEQFRLNLRSTYLICAAAVAHMLSRGDGSIVCVSPPSSCVLRASSSAAE